MQSSRLKAVLAFISVMALPHLAIGQVREGQFWESWSRIYFTKDMSTEWLVANDKDAYVHFTPQQTIIYFLVPPTVTAVGRHWEITFDSTGQKKTQLAEHYYNTGALNPHPADFKGAPRNNINWPLYVQGPGRPYCPWLLIMSKEFVAAKREPLNVDHENTGSPTAYNLDPDDAVGIAFLEPVVTEQDGEWLLTTKSNPTDRELTDIASDYTEWEHHHPGPRGVPVPRKIVYPPELQKEYDVWWMALKKWQTDGAQGTSPRLEDYFLVTPEQQKQYVAWQKAKLAWMQGDGVTPFPQPIDYMKDDDSQPKSPVTP